MSGPVDVTTDRVQLGGLRSALTRRWATLSPGPARAEALRLLQAVDRALARRASYSDRAAVGAFAGALVAPEEVPGCPTCPDHEGELLRRVEAGLACLACDCSTLVVVADPRAAAQAGRRRRKGSA